MKNEHTNSLFEYDRLINEDQFCNFKQEQLQLLKFINSGNCVKIYGHRNFGKTSLIKNIIGKKWQAANKTKRTVVYIDLYSVSSLEDISLEFTKAFQKAINSKKTLFDKGLDWLKMLKRVRPAWTISPDSDSLGNFVLTTIKDEAIIPFDIIIENIQILQEKGKLEFFIILDEFQEVARIKKGDALLRGALQQLSSQIPVAILGSKQHLLRELFENPKAPFYNWGHAIELGNIDYKDYHHYLEERFKKVKKQISLDSAIYLQDLMNRTPEAINRLADYIAQNSKLKTITIENINKCLQDYLENARSIYEQTFATFSNNQKIVLLAMAKLQKIHHLTGKDLLTHTKTISKSGLNLIMTNFLNESIISQDLDHEKKQIYQITDPYFREYLLTYKTV